MLLEQTVRDMVHSRTESVLPCSNHSLVWTAVSGCGPQQELLQQKHRPIVCADACLHALLESCCCHVDNSSSLLSLLQLPTFQVCLQALKQLDTAQQADTTAAGKVGLEQSAFLQDALLRRLADDEPAVVTTVLSLPSLDALPGATLYTALAALVTKSVQVLRIAGRKSEHKAWQNVARKVQPCCGVC